VRASDPIAKRGMRFLVILEQSRCVILSSTYSFSSVGKAMAFTAVVLGSNPGMIKLASHSLICGARFLMPGFRPKPKLFHANCISSTCTQRLALYPICNHTISPCSTVERKMSVDIGRNHRSYSFGTFFSQIR